MRLLAESWAMVTADTVKNCYRKAGWIRDEDAMETAEYLDEALEPENRSGLPDEEFALFIGVDDQVVTSNSLSDLEIFEMVREDHAGEDALNEDDDTNDSFMSENSSTDPLQALESSLLESETPPEAIQLFYQLKSKLNYQT
jgi:hypothetical protein